MKVSGSPNILFQNKQLFWPKQPHLAEMTVSANEFILRPSHVV